MVSFPLCLEIIFGLTIWDYVSALVTNSHSPNTFSIHWWSFPEAVINEAFLVESFLLHLLMSFVKKEPILFSSLSFLFSPLLSSSPLFQAYAFLLYTHILISLSFTKGISETLYTSFDKLFCSFLYWVFHLPLHPRISGHHVLGKLYLYLWYKWHIFPPRLFVFWFLFIV